MKKDGIMKLTSIIMVLFVVVFAGYHAIRHFYSSYSTESAYRYTVYNTASTEGLIIRNEQTLSQSYSGYLKYLVQDGEKVKSGTAIASTFSNQSDANHMDSNARLNKELSMLQAVQKQLKTNSASDISQISDDIDLAVSNLSYAVMTGDYSKLQSLSLTTEEKLNAKALMTGDSASVDDRVAALQGLVNQTNSNNQIYSSGVGYFSHCVDGYETTFNSNMIGNITADDLNGMLGKDYSYQEGALGKLVTDDGWYYVTTMTKEEAETFTEGSTAYLHFSGSNNDAAEAKVYKVQLEDGKNRAVVTFYSTAVNSDTVSRRKVKVEVTSQAYIGIRFDSDRLHIVDGVKGVYVDAGYTVKFKKVDIIYSGKGFYLSKLNYTGEDTLNIFDKLVVSNADLYDGMALNNL